MSEKYLLWKRVLRSVLLVLLLSAVGMGKMYSQSFTVGDLNYQVNNDGISVTVTGHVDGQNATGSLVIPETVESNSTTYPVTAIGEIAFLDCSGFTSSLIIPNSVTMIGWGAFAGCSGFSGDLTVGNSVTTISSVAFEGCSGFTGSLTIPNSVTTIGEAAFAGCSGFTGSLTIGNSVTSIGNSAFSDCSGFTGRLTIPNSITTIGVAAFYYCSGFTGNLTIGNSVTTIGNSAFGGCSGFTSMTIFAETPPILGSDAFYEVNKIIPVYVPFGTVSAYQAASGWNEFTNIQEYGSCPIIFADANVKAICVTNWDTNGDGELSYDEAAAVTDLGQVFRRNTTITSFEELQYFIGLTTIGSYAFYFCSNLTSISIPNSITLINSFAFQSCSSLNSIIIPNSVTSINYGAFSDCIGLTSIEIPLSVTSIVGNPFNDCGLEQIFVDSENTVYDSRDNCNAIIKTSTNELVTGCKNTVIPNSVTTIGNSAFRECRGLISIEIPNSVISIGSGAFMYCGTLTSIEIPNSVTSIGNGAFEWCGLRFMNILPETPPVLGNDVFSYVHTNIPVYVPCGAVEEYQEAIEWSNFTNITGMCSGEVIVTANPSEGGSVLGAGYYNGGDVCVLTATPNPDFVFVNWIENGLIVSVDSVYSFYAHPTTLVANFCSNSPIVFVDANVKAICIANWDDNGDGELSYAEAATVTSLGGVFINKSSITSFNELQYFVNLTSIGDYSFDGCSSLTSIEIPFSVTSIGSRAFKDCRDLASIKIPTSLAYMGINPFIGCIGLEQIIVDSGNLVYDSRGECNAIITTNSNTLVTGCKNTVIPNSVTSIGSDAFYGCSSLTSINIPNSVTSIGSQAFNGCSSLTSINIPNSVTSIGNTSFRDCVGLTEVIMLRTIPPILYSNAFDNTSFPIYVPYESLNEYKTALYWWNYYEDRIFPMAYTTVAGYGEGEGNYRFIASPLVENTAPTAVDNMITETAYDLYRFDQSEDAEWQNYKYPENTPNFFLTNGQGYLYANAEDVNVIFKGEFNEDDTKDVELVYDDNADFVGWNLVGNPFPVSAYANKSYYTMNEDGTGIEPNMVSSATAIPACTGVMVMAGAEDETVVFSTEAPETATNRGCLQIALSQAVNRDGVSTGSVTALDKAIVSFNAGDRLEKFVFNKENAVISIPQGGKELSIACSDKQGEVPLNFKATKNGEYTLTINPEAVELDYLHLIDNLTGADVDLLVTPAYTFTAKTTDYASRFRLVFSGNEADGPTTGSGSFAFINNGNIVFIGMGGEAFNTSLQIVDMQGRVIVFRDAVPASLSTAGMVPGVYVLRLVNGDEVRTQKLVVR